MKTITVTLPSGAPTGDVGLTLALVVWWMAWYGRAPGRAVVPGLLGGSLAFGAPLLARLGGFVSLGCGATPSCLTAAIAGGVGAGVLVALISRGRFQALLWGLAVAGGLAALTCLPLGGTALLAAGAAAAISAPLVRLVRPATA